MVDQKKLVVLRDSLRGQYYQESHNAEKLLSIGGGLALTGSVVTYGLNKSLTRDQENYSSQLEGMVEGSSAYISVQSEVQQAEQQHAYTAGSFTAAAIGGVFLIALGFGKLQKAKKYAKRWANVEKIIK